MIDFSSLPQEIRSCLNEFCETNGVSRDLIDCWDNKDNGIFVPKSERFFASLKFNRCEPSRFIENSPPIRDPNTTEDSRKLVSVLYEHLRRQYGRLPQILDVGEFLGRFSIESAKFLRFGGIRDKIYVFEPGMTVPLMKANLLLNAVDDLVDISRVAVSNQEGTAIYEYACDNLISGNICGHGKFDRGHETLTVKLNVFLRNKKILAPLIVKIDTEGAEARVLEGAVEYESFLDSVYIIEFWREYLKSQVGGVKVDDFMHDHFLIYNIGSSLYPRKMEPALIDDIEQFGREFDPRKGNLDLMLIPKRMRGLEELQYALRARTLI